MTVPRAILVSAIAIAAILPSCSGPDTRDAKPIRQACSPPRAYWDRPHPIGLMPMHNRIAIDHNSIIYWNGAPVSRAQLADFLTAAVALVPRPMTFLETEAGAPCDVIEAVRDEMDRRLNCRKDGLCAEGVESVWRNLPLPPGTPPS